MKLSFTALMTTLALTLLLSGCNTVEGLGKDMQQGGQKIQKAANENQ